ncbi:exosortase B [Curvibacter sp. APW13]|uniref:exosortase B n=1 Tax=Curvibacter sp. APW13 TaxID=3077236 RepID=UPI0028DE9D48|nr:exosortase B [Curvibacter sp. APW13]MDT8992590.1 exosortase B [Curvibacter sp. APW13]
MRELQIDRLHEPSAVHHSSVRRSMAQHHRTLKTGARSVVPVNLMLLASLCLLYLPTLIDLFIGVWSTEAQMQGPVVLTLSLWLMARNWLNMKHMVADKKSAAWGWPVLLLGLSMYAIGRSQDVLFLEVGSSVWVIAALLLLQYGTRALKVQWFPLFFMLFMIPLPAAVVDTVTMPMKMVVSYVAEEVLYWAGYPIGRSGIILQIGHYKLLVADACAGLHTLLTLEALGLLYLNLVRRDSLFRNIGLALLIVPISFSANVIRVVTLSLITYHFGDAAGQGFLHGFAGMVLFMSALILIIVADTALHAMQSRTKGSKHSAVNALQDERPGTNAIVAPSNRSVTP